VQRGEALFHPTGESGVWEKLDHLEGSKFWGVFLVVAPRLSLWLKLAVDWSGKQKRGLDQLLTFCDGPSQNPSQFWKNHRVGFLVSWRDLGLVPHTDHPLQTNLDFSKDPKELVLVFLRVLVGGAGASSLPQLFPQDPFLRSQLEGCFHIEDC
jgi:hypothetical protein